MSNTAVLDENDIVTVVGDITVYHYDKETREYTSSSVEYPALGVGTPVHSCADAPPEAISGHAACRTVMLNGWEHVSDHRGETVYSTEDDNLVLITQPGDYSADTITKQPATPWDTWNGKTWVTDTERQRAAELEVARQQRQQRMEQAMTSADLINLKLRASRNLTPEETAKLNAVLDYIDELDALDTSTAPEINWPEAPLALTNWTVSRRPHDIARCDIAGMN